MSGCCSISHELLTTRAPLAVALAASGAIAFAAWRARSLSRSGAFAAVAVGTVSLVQAWGWGAFLILWFLLASLVSMIGRARKAARTLGVVEKGNRRDAIQVLANGGLYATAALATAALVPAEYFDGIAIAAAASLAATGADTWATEIGTLAGGQPWSLRVGRRVAVGTSGAITGLGTASAGGGACVLALVAGALAVVPQTGIAAVAIGGFVGAMADTLVGAWWQERRWCPTCDLPTEQRVHNCGTTTRQSGGVALLDNDAVNFTCAATGAACALLLWRVQIG